MSLQRLKLCAAGGKTAQEVLRFTFGLVIRRPSLAQYYNTGGAVKSGSVLGDTQPKRNIMGTKFKSLLMQACKRVEPDLSMARFKTYMSDFLKRSSQMKGGEHF
jgi:hypothetical protein